MTFQSIEEDTLLKKLHNIIPIKPRIFDDDINKESKKAIILLLSEIEQSYKEKLDITLNNFDRLYENIIRQRFLDFILFSFNTASWLGHGIILPNVFLIKTICLIQVLINIIFLIAILNFYNFS